MPADAAMNRTRARKYSEHRALLRAMKHSRFTVRCAQPSQPTGRGQPHSPPPAPHAALGAAASAAATYEYTYVAATLKCTCRALLSRYRALSSTRSTTEQQQQTNTSPHRSFSGHGIDHEGELRRDRKCNRKDEGLVQVHEAELPNQTSG